MGIGLVVLTVVEFFVSHAIVPGGGILIAVDKIVILFVSLAYVIGAAFVLGNYRLGLLKPRDKE